MKKIKNNNMTANVFVVREENLPAFFAEFTTSTRSCDYMRENFKAKSIIAKRGAFGGDTPAFVDFIIDESTNTTGAKVRTVINYRVVEYDSISLELIKEGQKTETINA